jgi:hypothetical protein
MREVELEGEEVKLTKLDKLLTEEQAYSLEEYVHCAAIREGKIRTSDAGGYKNASKAHSSGPILDSEMRRLKHHAAILTQLDAESKAVLREFCFQQWGSTCKRTDAQLGLEFCGDDTRDKALAWRLRVAAVAARLVSIGQALTARERGTQ